MVAQSVLSYVDVMTPIFKLQYLLPKGCTNVLVTWYTHRMASATGFSGDRLLDGLTTEQALSVLADYYLDAYEWRTEESALLAEYQKALNETRAQVHKLSQDLGEIVPPLRVLTRPRWSREVRV